VISVAALVAFGGIFLAFLLRSSPDAAGPRIHGNRVTLVSPPRRKPLPDLSGPALDPPPSSLGLEALAGKPAFVDVWASWCVPCRAEAPVLARLWRRYRDRVQFLGIDIEDTRGDARAFVRRYGLGYANIFDRTASMAGKLGFVGLPTAFLIDARGRIAGKLVGQQHEATLRRSLDALVRHDRLGAPRDQHAARRERVHGLP
jgi:cytochrome c biogenesis protein CcmG/thiol:disulfide interchange protein DsbE